MNEDARIEAVARMLAEWDRAGYWDDAEDRYRALYRDEARKLLAAADAVSGVTVVNTDDLRAVLDALGRASVMDGDARALVAYSRLIAQTGRV